MTVWVRKPLPWLLLSHKLHLLEPFLMGKMLPPPPPINHVGWPFELPSISPPCERDLDCDNTHITCWVKTWEQQHGRSEPGGCDATWFELPGNSEGKAHPHQHCVRAARRKSFSFPSWLWDSSPTPDPSASNLAARAFGRLAAALKLGIEPRTPPNHWPFYPLMWEWNGFAASVENWSRYVEHIGCSIAVCIY